MSARTLAEYGRRAAEMLDPAVWDVLAGGADESSSLAADAVAFDQVRLRSRVPAGAGRAVTGTSILGRPWAAPIGIAPVACQTLVHGEGEVATARAAGAAGLPFVVSTFAGRTFEDIAAAAGGPLWLQVSCFRDRTVTRELIRRAERAGFEALVLTGGGPSTGRDGSRLPPEIVPANLDTRLAPPPEIAAGPDIDRSVLDWLRSVSSLPVLIEGVVTGADAARAVRAGAEGIVVPNHGGCRADGVPAGLAALPEVVEAVGGACPVLLDGGVRRGRDVLAALALGASGVLLGPPVLHGLAVMGGDGVAEVLDILIAELTEAMTQTGIRSVADAGPTLITPGPAAPPASGRATGGLRKSELHASLSDPVLDTMNFLNEITLRHPEAISFAPGRPYDGFFDTEEIFTHMRRYLAHLEERGHTTDRIRAEMFQYGPTAGQIRELIADSLRRDENIDVPSESIVVTVGCQEAMFLALRALIAGPADVLLVASPCYVGISGAARLLDVPLTAVDEGPDGFRCADLKRAIEAERSLGRRPRACYVLPDHANPSGMTIPPGEREALLELADREDILILEDSPYRTVSPGRQAPTLKSLDRRRRVVHLGSYSKTLFPGARVGFAVADQVVTDEAGGTSLLADELAKIKSMVTVNTSALSQAAVGGMLLAGGTYELNSRTSAYYGDAMQATLRELEACFPEAERESLGVRWNRPSGGFFLTLAVPFPADNAALARSVGEHGVIWTPMSYFYPQGGGEHTIRLSTSYLSHEEIVEGTARLARFIRAEAER